MTITDPSEARMFSQEISAASDATHSGEVNLAGVDIVWISLQEGNITVGLEQPGF